MTDEDRGRILDWRRSKRSLQLGKGGEGYIAEDEWCYNCGEAGHWGDVHIFLSYHLVADLRHPQDCRGPKRYDKPAEPSAFGLYNISTGPFDDHDESGTGLQRERRLRDWEREDQFGDWGKYAPDHVGRQGRKKMMERMRKSAQRFEEESDPEDWFENPRNARSRGAFPSSSSNTRRNWEGDRQRDKDREWQRDREHHRDIDRERERDRRRERDRERERDRDRERSRRREKGRDEERRQGREKNQDNAHDMKIKFSASIGAGRNPLPPLPPGLPIRPQVQLRPSLLDRLSDHPLGDLPPSRNGSQPRNATSLSIRGASQKQGLDEDHRSHRPQYRGGYSGYSRK